MTCEEILLKNQIPYNLPVIVLRIMSRNKLSPETWKA